MSQQMHGEWVEQAKYDAVTTALKQQLDAALSRVAELTKLLREGQGLVRVALQTGDCRKNFGEFFVDDASKFVNDATRAGEGS